MIRDRANLFYNLMLATFLIVTAVVGYAMVERRIPELVEFGFFFALTIAIVINVMRRLRASYADTRWWVCFVVTLSLFYYLAFEPGLPANESWAWWAYGAMLGCHFVGCLACLYLGRSFSVLPACREIRTGFVYRLVRHPIYALYIVADMFFVVTVPTGWNVLVWVAGAGLFYLRVILEENILGKDECYQAYMKRTRWRLVPFVL